MARTVNLGQIVPNIQIGETTTTPPSSSASVVNVGTELNPILNFSIPKGDTGSAGADAKINGVNTLTIEAGTNITLDQEGSTLTINSTGGGSGGTSDYTDLTNKPKINNIELKGNKSLNDLGIQPSGNYALESEIPDVSNFITKDVNNLTYYTLSSGLSSVATSGSYNDLSNKPTIPSEVTETTVSNWGFTKNTGTITGITMNGASKGTSGVVDLGTVITSHQDISGKLDTSKVKNANSTTAGDVYDVRYINNMIGDVETILTRLTTGSGV